MTIQATRRDLLPGIAVSGYAAAPRPDRLNATGALLLAGVAPGRVMGLSEHQTRWGLAPHLDLPQLIAAADAVDLRGAGGAGFPSAAKMRSLSAAGQVGPIVVNGAEGEHASAKDGVLLMHVPHLVLDGAVTTARAMGSKRIIVRVAEGRQHVLQALRTAVSERHDPGVRIEVSVGPDRFIAGEATAIIRSLQGGPALPDALGKPPVMRTGLKRRPVMLSNVETFARLAVASRGDRRRSSLVTISGAVRYPGVIELPEGATVLEALVAVGGVDSSSRLLVTGGWHGAWVMLDDRVLAARLDREGLAAVGGRWGAGVLVVLPDDPCPLDVLRAVADHLAAETAGQCGPCFNGMPALADALRRGDADIDVLLESVSGRGLCAHPTASAAAIRSAAHLLADEMARHRAGICGAA